MAKMDVLIQNTGYINEALSAIRDITVNGDHDYAAQSKADAMGGLVRAREETNRQTLGFLERIYNDLKPSKGKKFDVGELAALDIDFNDLVSGLPPGEKKEIIFALLGK
jgi:hypothetical protein